MMKHSVRSAFPTGLTCASFNATARWPERKGIRKHLLTIAEEVANQITGCIYIHKIEVVRPGFINISVQDEFLADYAEQMYHDKFKGIPQAEAEETIVLDYGNPNVAKPLHVGHLRSTIIGEALKRIITATGRKAVGDVHLGDWGLPMGLVLAELEERYADTLPTLTTDLLNEIYPAASRKSKTNEVFLEKARTITARLQKGDTHYTKIWCNMVEVSVKEIRKKLSKIGRFL